MHISALNEAEIKIQSLISLCHSASFESMKETLNLTCVPSILEQNFLTGEPKKTDHSVKSLTKYLQSCVNRFKNYHLLSDIVEHFMKKISYFINAKCFNGLLQNREFCHCANGLQIKMGITELEEWFMTNGFQSSLQYLVHIRQAADGLTMNKTSLLNPKAQEDACPSLKISQLKQLLVNYSPDIAFKPWCI